MTNCLRSLFVLFFVLACQAELPPHPDTLPQILTKTEVTPGVSDGHAFQYHDYEGLTAFLHEIQTNFSQITQLSSIGRTVAGRELWTLRITSNVDVPPSVSGKAQVLLVANMHGDETVGREVLVHWIQDVCDLYGSDETVTNMVENTDVTVVVSLNPDGFEDQRRYNGHSVDLNRDFPDQYSGGGNTQPETKAMTSFIEINRFSLGFNMHGGSLVCNYPWDSNPRRVGASYCPDDQLYIHLCHTYNTNHRTMNTSNFPNGMTNGADWYIVSHGLQDYSYLQGMLHVTLELSYTKFVSESFLESEWLNNKDAVYAYVNSVHQGVRGKVEIVKGNETQHTNDRVVVVTFDPVESPSVTPESSGMQSMPTRTHLATGTYHRVLLDGQYLAVASAEDCQNSTKLVTVDGLVQLNFQLDCEGNISNNTRTPTDDLKKKGFDNTMGIIVLLFGVSAIVAFLVVRYFSNKARTSSSLLPSRLGADDRPHV